MTPRAAAPAASVDALRGEITFDAQGQTWRMAFSVPALRSLEATFGKTCTELGGMLGSLSLDDQAAFWRAGLMEHHGDVDRVAAERLLGVVGLIPSLRLIAVAYAGAFDIAADDEAEAGDEAAADPRKPGGAGTGTAS